MGFREISRREYLNRLSHAAHQPDKKGRWSIEAGVAQVADWQPG
jgi:hypothetical protein